MARPFPKLRRIVSGAAHSSVTGLVHDASQISYDDDLTVADAIAEALEGGGGGGSLPEGSDTQVLSLTAGDPDFVWPGDLVVETVRGGDSSLAFTSSPVLLTAPTFIVRFVSSVAPDISLTLPTASYTEATLVTALTTALNTHIMANPGADAGHVGAWSFVPLGFGGTVGISFRVAGLANGQAPTLTAPAPFSNNSPSTAVTGALGATIASVSQTATAAQLSATQAVTTANAALLARHVPSRLYQDGSGGTIDTSVGYAAPTKPTFVPIVLPVSGNGGASYTDIGVRVETGGDTVLNAALYSSAFGALSKITGTDTTITCDTTGIHWGSFGFPVSPSSGGQYYLGVTDSTGVGTSLLKAYKTTTENNPAGRFDLLPVATDGLGWSAGLRAPAAATTMPSSVITPEAPDVAGAGFNAPVCFLRKS